MNDFFKNNKVILAFILLLAIGLRLWLMKDYNALSNDEYIAYSYSAFTFPFDFFEAFKTNSFAPLHALYLSLYGAIFGKISFMIPLSSFVANILAIIVMYYTGRTYFTKNNSIQIGLACALLSAISMLLISSSFGSGVISFTFLLSSLVLLFSVKNHQQPCKNNAILLLISSVLLVLEHTIAIIFVIFNAFSLVAFANRGKKNNDIFVPLICFLIVCLPLVPFLIRIFAHPTYLSKWWSPFNWYDLCFYFTDLFSPVLSRIQNIFSNVGFIIFALVPSVIAIALIIKSNIDAKKLNRSILLTSVATFLTVALCVIAGKLAFHTKYLIELYPGLILLASCGWAQLNSKSQKISIATIYVFMTLFFIIASHIPGINLI